MDFAARIALVDGTEKLVLIEIQKAKLSSDIMRCRKYLGAQYASSENSYTIGDELKAMPIVSIYFLGHSLESLHAPVIRVERRCLDVSGKVLQGPTDPFIASLTHDSFIVKIPYLKQQHQTDLESLLGLFDQAQRDPADAHSLGIREEEYPEKFHPVIFRLIRAISEPEIREVMEVEDTYLADMETIERTVAAKEVLLGKKDIAISEKDVVISAKELLIAEKEALIQKKEALIEQKESESQRFFAKAMEVLIGAGLSQAEAREQFVGKSMDQPPLTVL